MRYVVLLIFLFLAACNEGSSPIPLPLSSGVWQIVYSPNMPAYMTGSDGAYYFDFPPQDGVHYIYRNTEPPRLSQRITMMFTIQGDGSLVPTQGDQPARVRLFIQQSGDTLTAAEQSKRWWSVDPNVVELKSGDFTLSAVLQPDQWSDVFGKPGTDNPAGFATAVGLMAHIGFTFGGTFAGHGVYANGPSRFILRGYEVN